MTTDEGRSNRSPSSTSGCSGPHSPPERPCCSHFPIPAPTTDPFLKSNPPLPFFLLQAPVLFPRELSASPHHAPYFSRHIQPVPALWHFSHFPSFPLHDHTNTLRLPLALSCVTQPHPQGAALWLLCPLPFLLASAIPAASPSSSSAPASHKRSSKSLWPMLGLHCGLSSQSHFQRKATHSAFPSPL